MLRAAGNCSPGSQIWQLVKRAVDYSCPPVGSLFEDSCAAPLKKPVADAWMDSSSLWPQSKDRQYKPSDSLRYHPDRSPEALHTQRQGDIIEKEIVS